MMFLIGQAGKAGSTLGPLPFPQPQPFVAIGVFARGEARRRKGKEGEAGPTNSVAFAGAPSTADVCVPPPLTPLPHHRHPSLLLSPIALQPRPPARPAGSSFVALGALSSRHWLAAVLFGGSRRGIQCRKARQKKAICSVLRSTQCILKHALDPLRLSAGSYPPPALSAVRCPCPTDAGARSLLLTRWCRCEMGKSPSQPWNLPFFSILPRSIFSHLTLPVLSCPHLLTADIFRFRSRHIPAVRSKYTSLCFLPLASHYGAGEAAAASSTCN
jgi:hypothetical protein